MKRSNLIAIAFAFTLVCVAPRQLPAEEREGDPEREAMTALAQLGEYTRFARLLNESGLLDDLSPEFRYTLFAISDETLEKMLAREWDELLDDKTRLRRIAAGFIALGDVSNEAIGHWNREEHPLHNISGKPIEELEVADIQNEDATQPWRVVGEPSEHGRYTIFRVVAANPRRIVFDPIVVPPLGGPADDDDEGRDR